MLLNLGGSKSIKISSHESNNSSKSAVKFLKSMDSMDSQSINEIELENKIKESVLKNPDAPLDQSLITLFYRQML